MKYRPILMNEFSVRGILEKHKNMTRRTKGLERINENPDAWQFMGIDNNGEYVFYNPTYYDEYNGISIAIKCPYGKVGDRLWVRETIRLTPEDIYYKADEMSINFERLTEDQWDWLNDYDGNRHNTTIPSIHMKRYLSRITLEITKIRVERVQEITRNDMIDEGIGILLPPYCTGITGYFIRLWDSLNAKRGYGWDKNPFVFPIDFKVVK